jgi:hypothetical protein
MRSGVTGCRNSRRCEGRNDVTVRSASKALDPEVVTAIHDAVRQQGQPDKLGNRIVAWIEALSLGRTTLDNDSEVEQYFDVTTDAVEVGEEGSDG